MSPPFKSAEAATGQSQNRYHRETLENGMTVVIKENHDSRVVGVHLSAKGRSLCEGKEKWGMAEVLQRMLLDAGTVNHPEEQLYQAFQSIGAELKLSDNPNIPYDDYYNSPRFAYMRLKVVDFFFEEGIRLLAEIVSQPLLTEDALNRPGKMSSRYLPPLLQVHLKLPAGCCMTICLLQTRDLDGHLVTQKI